MCAGREIAMQPYDKTSPFQQWVVSDGQLCSAVDSRRVLQLKPGSVFSSASVVAVDNVTPANQHRWFFHYIPHQRVSFKCVELFCVFFFIIVRFYTWHGGSAGNTIEYFSVFFLIQMC